MGLSDQFKDKAQDMADRAKSAMGRQDPKAEEAEQKAMEQAEGGAVPADQDTAEMNMDEEWD